MPLSPQMVHDRLRAAARRYRWSRGARPLISGCALAVALLALFVIGDSQFHFGTGARWTAFSMVAAALVIGGAAAFRACFPIVSEESMARRIEGACSGSRNVLISAVQFDRELAADSPLRPALFREMDDPFPGVAWSEVFDLPLLKKLGMAFGAAVLTVVLWGIVRPAYFANSAARLFMPGSSIAPLTRTCIANIEPGDAQVVNGASLALTAEMTGDLPRVAWLYSRETGARWEKILMDRETGNARFSYQWPRVHAPLEYYIEAGDAVSPVHRVAVRPRTAIRERVAEIQPPAYSKLPKTRVRDFAVLHSILPGSNIAISLEFNHPIVSLRASEEGSLAIGKLDETHWRLEGRVMASRTVKLDFRDSDGSSDSDSIPITVKPDSPPKITVTEPREGKELLATRDASLLVQLTGSASFGLGSLALYRSTPEKPDAQLVQDWSDASGKDTYSAQAAVPLAAYTAGGEERVTFTVIAKDRNDVTGPGVTVSRPIVVSLQSAEKLKADEEEAGDKVRRDLEALIKLQQANLDQTQAAASARRPEALGGLLTRQVQVSDLGALIAASAESVSPEIRSDLRALGEREMKEVVLTLRDAQGVPPGEAQGKSLARAASLESVILARLKGAPAAIDADAKAGAIQDVVAGLDDLLRKQRDIVRETNSAALTAAQPLSTRQDALADQSATVKKSLAASAQNPALGDQDFRARLGKVVAMFGDLRVYEDMLAAAEKLQAKDFSTAGGVEKSVVTHLGQMTDLLNQWQLAHAGEHAEELKKALDLLKEKLDRLAALQREVTEKSKEMARKDQFDPADRATSEEIRETKDLMAKVVEQMLTDAHVFPDLKPSNDLRSELTSIYEDVIQTDKDAAAAGTLKPTEIAVQKEDGLLQGIEEAKKISEDMEMWLPHKLDTTKWLDENFDKSEMPEIPNLPLPDKFEDLVGKLLDEQKDLAEQIQDASSNQAFAQNPANGWEVVDGPMPGFGAQGRSGNQRPKQNEQTGRSSGGREGMSDGEMVGDTASNLEGSKTKVRRTNDPLQKGQVKDSGGPADARATGGGKASGFSDRQGMDGNAPLRSTNAPAQLARDALAVKQALLAEKTSKTYAKASLLYLKAGAMPEVAQLMNASGTALREGRIRDFSGLHQQIVGRLKEVANGITSASVVSLPSAGAVPATDRTLLGGSEGDAPATYRNAVADYYRSLAEDK